MVKHHNYDTASEAVNDLIRRGFTTDFIIETERNSIICHHPSIELSPDEFEIDEIYRFEGPTDPGDEMIVFGISSNKHKVKGVLVNAFGVYDDNKTSDVTKKLHRHL